MQGKHMKLRFSHNDREKMQETLARLQGLGECVIKELVWLEPALTLLVELWYVWTDDNRICFTVGEEPRLITLRFDVVNDLVLHNALNSAQMTNPEHLNWGISEIAGFGLVDDQNIAAPLIKAQFVWEGERRIEITCLHITITM